MRRFAKTLGPWLREGLLNLCLWPSMAITRMLGAPTGGSLAKTEQRALSARWARERLGQSVPSGSPAPRARAKRL